MLQESTLILNNLEVSQKLNRIAFQILEDNYKETEIHLLGLEINGVKIAEKLKAIMEENSAIKVNLVAFKMNKNKPASEEVNLNVAIEELADKVLILVDDVANTGKVLTYAMKPLLSILPKKIRAMVLVDRRHKKYPITPDFIGLSLATTMKEHINVQIEEDREINVFLN